MKHNDLNTSPFDEKGGQYLGGLRVVHHSVDVDSFIRDVVQHGAHGDGGIPQDVVLPNLQQLAPVAQAPHTGLQGPNSQSTSETRPNFDLYVEAHIP